MIVWISELLVSPEGQQHSSGMHGQWLAALEGVIASMAIACVSSVTLLKTSLVAAGQQPGQGFPTLVLDCMVGGRPVGHSPRHSTATAERLPATIYTIHHQLR
nr:hypothetical protein [Streptomyces chartreusis]